MVNLKDAWQWYCDKVPSKVKYMIAGAVVLIAAVIAFRIIF